MQIKIICFLVYLVSFYPAYSLFGQIGDIPREMVTYHDKDKKIIKEHFYYINNDVEQKHGKYILYFPSSKSIHIEAIYQKGKLNGLYKEYYEDSGIKTVYNYQNGVKEGVYKKFYETGQLEILCNYKGNKIIGEMKRFYRDNSLKAKLNFKDGKRKDTMWVYYPIGYLQQYYIFKDDLRNGTFAIYDESKHLIQKGVYKNDKLEGEVLSFYPNQNIKKRVIFKADTIHGKMEVYYPDKTLKEETNYEKNLRQGSSKQYYPNGMKKVETYYEKNLLTKEHIIYYFNGQVKRLLYIDQIGGETGSFKTYDSLGYLESEGHLLNGTLHAENKAYFPGGKIRHKFNYEKGRKKGINITYYPNGDQRKVEKEIGENYFEITNFQPNNSLISKTYLRRGKAVGTWKYFFETGGIKQSENYKNGVLVGEQIIYYLSKTGTSLIKQRFSYINGKKGGISTVYYKSGNRKSEIFYEKDIIKGLVKNYYESGKIESRGNQYRNRKTGRWQYFDSNEKLIKEEMYRGGIIVKKATYSNN